jgi:outer membrane biosynthesis protein TonB
VLRLYIESWRTKIERNGPLNYRPAAGMRAPDYPVVTVALRSDGSVEHVHFHRSSGLREVDNAVRRIVEFYAPYSRFPPALASQYDVIEIRRVWQLDDTLRIVEETR